MAIQINGNGTITGISVGGLPNGIVDTDMLAANAVSSAKIADGAATGAKLGLPAGSIVQYVRAVPQEVNDRLSMSSSSWTDTGIQIQITPTNSSNRIVVQGHFCTHVDTANGGIYLAFNDDSNTLDYQSSIDYFPNTGWRTMPVRYERIAGTTNQMTFTLYWYRYGNGNAYLGWDSGASSSSTNQNGAYLVAYEVQV